MTYIDPKQPVFAQERLVWVAPKISLMETNQTEGKVQFTHEGQCTPNGVCFPSPLGPS